MAETNKQDGSRRPVPAVTKALAIMRCLARSSEPMGVNAIARSLELVPSTCLHILRVLQDEGLAEFDPETKQYTLGVGILPLARSVMQRNPFAALATPRLTDLSEKFGVTAIATQKAEGDHMVVVALSHSRQPFRLQVDLGSRFPLNISATGRLFAAYGDDDTDALKERFEKLQWDHPPSFDDWLAQVEKAKETGFGVDPGNYISGVTVVAVPVFGSGGKMNRSLVAVGISESLKNGTVQTLASALTEIRDDISRQRFETGTVQ